MKKMFLVCCLIGICAALNAQFTLYKEVQGVKFYTKWGHEKWWSKKSARVLLVKVVNTNDSAASYHFGFELTKNLQLVEESKDETHCLDPNGKSLPRLQGVIFKPGAAPGDYDSWELSDLEVVLVSNCETE